MKRRAGLGPARRTPLVAAIAAIFAAVTAGVFLWELDYERELASAERDGRAQLSFLIGALEKDFTRYKLLAKALSQTGAVRRRATEDIGADGAAQLLERMAAISGAASIDFLTMETATGGPRMAATASAYNGVMGMEFDPEAGAFIIAAPVWDAARVVGAVVVKLEASGLEFAWRALPRTVFFTGDGGVVRLSSRAALRGRTLHTADASLPPLEAFDRGERVFWRFSDARWSALGVGYAEAMVLTEAAPSMDMNAFSLVDATPARAGAWIAAVAGGATVFAIGMLLAVAFQRRAAYAARLTLEARAKAELELKVADRTAELSAEIAERRATEAALRGAQDEIVQAGKLSALGAMAAGIAHEINQPLSAIRAFADNAGVLLDKGREGEARANLSKIAELTSRTARIIRNLRAFARNEPEDMSTVSILDVVDDALTIMEPRIRSTGAAILWERPASNVFVRGGGVRLQQVLVNLISNALDAQGDGAPRVEIAVEEAAAAVRVIVRDEGPGVAPEIAGKLFDPFFSTKTGGGDSLGLGLSISYNIVKGCGGELRLRNREGGGAAFTVELKRAEPLGPVEAAA